VRVYSQRIYGIPPEQIVGTAGDRKPILTKDPKLLLNDNFAGKLERAANAGNHFIGWAAGKTAVTEATAAFPWKKCLVVYCS
jgi:hypothetical protein